MSNWVSLPWGVVRLQYKVIRFPLTVLRRLVVHAFDTDAPCRITYQEMLDSVDRKDGTILGDHTMALRAQTELLPHAKELPSSPTCVPAPPKPDSEPHLPTESPVNVGQRKHHMVY